MKSLHNTQESTLLLNVLMDYCDEIISVKSLDFKYLDCNTAFLKHFGFSTAEEVLGKSIFTLIPKESVDLVHSNLQKVLKEKQMRSYSFRINTNNKVKLVQQTSTPVILNGEIKYILTISRDVTQDQFLKENLLYKTMRFDTLMQHLPLLVYMKDKDKIEKLLKTSESGMITVAQVTEAGLHRSVLQELVKSGEIYRFGRGLYVQSDAWEDDFYLLQHKYGRGIYSHDTALYLLGY